MVPTGDGKPIGPVYEAAEAAKAKQAHGWPMVEEAGGKWRRVVPSSLPKRITQLASIRLLIEAGLITICAGGGSGARGVSCSRRLTVRHCGRCRRRDIFMPNGACGTPGSKLSRRDRPPLLLCALALRARADRGPDSRAATFVVTLADQVGACATVLRPLHALIEQHVLAADRLHGDDTTVPILAKSKTTTGRAWVYDRDALLVLGHEPIEQQREVELALRHAAFAVI
jgi:hypothetical protein